MATNSQRTASGNAQEDSKPWSDYDHGWSESALELFAEDPDYGDLDELEDSLRRDAWLEEEASLEEVLEIKCEHFVELDHDTRLDHNIYVVTDFETTPSEITLEQGFDATVDWILGCQRAIKKYTDYRVTNKRVVDGQLTLTLAPEEQ